MDEVEAKLLEYLNGAEALILSKAPTVYQAALNLIQINSIVTLAIGFIFLSALIVSVRLFWKLRNKLFKHSDPEDVVPLFFIGVIVNLGLLIPALVHLFDRAALIGAFNPELGLMYDLYTKITGGK